MCRCSTSSVAETIAEYLSTPQEAWQCCYKMMDSGVCRQNRQLICDALIDLTINHCSKDTMCIIYRFLLLCGREHPEVMRWMKKKDMFAILMNQVWDENMEMDELKCLSFDLMYDMCRLQKLDICDLKMVDEEFVGYLFDLVEHTRDIDDEAINYSVVKLILVFNEQFMVATLNNADHNEAVDNLILNTLTRRLGSSTTFGENLIFMLNRTADPCLHLLILKLLYLITTTPSLFEYFYTNDLRVLVDVFIRELCDLPEESEALRHTYLRVLHPLLTNTQLRNHPYKRQVIRRLLTALLGASSSHFKPVSSTTQRLVQRCMMVDWFQQTLGSNLEATRSDTSVNKVAESAPPPPVKNRINALALEGTSLPDSNGHCSVDMVVSKSADVVPTLATFSSSPSPGKRCKPPPPPPRRSWRTAGLLEKKGSQSSVTTASSYADSAASGSGPGSPVFSHSPTSDGSPMSESQTLCIGMRPDAKRAVSLESVTLGDARNDYSVEELSERAGELDLGAAAR